MIEFKLADLGPLISATNYWRENGIEETLYLASNRGKIVFSETYNEENHYAKLVTCESLSNIPETNELICYVEWPSGLHCLALPNSWETEAPYEGRPYQIYKWDCYTLVQDYMLREKGVTMEDFRDDLKLVKNTFAENSFVLNSEMQNWDPVAIPQVGDGILFSVDGNNEPSRNANHCGVYLGNNQFLHQFFNRTSCVEELSDKWKNWVVSYMRCRNG